MKQLVKRSGSPRLALGLSIMALALTVAAFYGGELGGAAPREVELLATGLTFRLADRQDQPNPTIKLRRGRPVKLVIRNSDPDRVWHCFSISGLNLKTTKSLAGGEAETLIFTPKKKGTFAYACLMHPPMVGKLIIE